MNTDVIFAIVGICIVILVLGAFVSVVMFVYRALRVIWYIATTPIRVVWRLF